jgi:NAD+ synthase (glutamine-hydrolysing)
VRTLRIALAQINSTVGDLPSNSRKICDYITEAKRHQADLVAFPELALTGYPPEDLLLKPQFVQDNLSALKKIIKHTRGITAVVGFVDSQDDIYNAAAVIHDGRLAGIYQKIFLPNYGVFDEDRYFQAGTQYPVFVLKGVTLGVNICEDIWYPDGPTIVQTLGGGAEVIVNISSSPYHAGKWATREKMLATRARDNAVIVAYNNLVGGQDELIFDGMSMILDQDGEILAHGKQFEEDLLLADLNVDAVFRSRLHDPRRRKEKLAFDSVENRITKTILSDRPVQKRRRPIRRQSEGVLPLLEEIYQALVLGVKDYVKKNGFSKVLIGLSGGIDSSLTAAIAMDALGAENVTGVFMPSLYSSKESQEDAALLAKNLGIHFITIPITDLFKSYLHQLASEFKGRPTDTTEENLQARIRGNLLMALSNKYRWLVLTTGNKSEFSVGYATLYGDMAGGFAVIKDVLKTLVYELARHRNVRDRRPVIPQRVFDKAPTAELKPNQTDQDSLPPYETLDGILQAYVEEDRSTEEIVKLGYDRKMAERVIAMVDRSEYKRRQSPLGIKISPRAFGKDRRVPITNRYR